MASSCLGLGNLKLFIFNATLNFNLLLAINFTQYANKKSGSTFRPLGCAVQPPSKYYRVATNSATSAATNSKRTFQSILQRMHYSLKCKLSIPTYFLANVSK